MPARIRLTELLAALSLTTDLGAGMPFEKGLRTCVAASALGSALRLPLDEQRAVFHAALLRSIGCTAHAPENAAMFRPRHEPCGYQGHLPRIRAGDIPAILDKIAPDCGWESWENNRAQREGVPTLQPRTGPEGVAQSFAAVGELEIHDFQVLDILVSERQVAVEVVIDFSTPAGGRSRDEELHLWTLNDHQQVTRLRHYVGATPSPHGKDL